jgi:molecular chaperone GrpE (heat shock protein)
VNNKEQKEIENNIDGEKIRQERDEYLDGWKRAKADLLNYKKDETKRLEEIIKFGSQEILRDLLPVLDSFDLALQVLEKDGHAEKGVQMIRNQLENVLKKRGLIEIKVNPGDAFDPNIHESIGEMESQESEGSVALEVEKGFMLHDKVLRASRVKLSKYITNNK